MISFSDQTKTIICIGSGGVGKTTMAASIAVGLAAQNKKVLVLTIDPSLRLAESLGIKPDGDVHSVNLEALDIKATLDASVINHKKIFDWFISNNASPQTVNKMQNNRLYQQLSNKLSGSQDFTSLVALNKFVSSGEYDVVILDTPPAEHTWQFLHAPEKISLLFNEGVSSWFREGTNKGLMTKFLNMGTIQVLKALEFLTGSSFMAELREFFNNIQNWQTQLEKYVLDCHRLLVSPQTEFILVTSPEQSRLYEAEVLSKEIIRQGYRLTKCIINKMPNKSLSHFDGEGAEVSAKIRAMSDYYQSLESSSFNYIKSLKTNVTVYKCHELSQNTQDAKCLYQNFKNID